MEQWEYRAESQGEMQSTDKFMQHLTELGKEGWEGYGVFVIQQRAIVYMKRSIQTGSSVATAS